MVLIKAALRHWFFALTRRVLYLERQRLEPSEVAILTRPFRYPMFPESAIENPHKLDRLLVDWQHDFTLIHVVERAIMGIVARGVVLD